MVSSNAIVFRESPGNLAHSPKPRTGCSTRVEDISIVLMTVEEYGDDFEEGFKSCAILGIRDKRSLQDFVNIFFNNRVPLVLIISLSWSDQSWRADSGQEVFPCLVGPSFISDVHVYLLVLNPWSYPKPSRSGQL